MKYFLLLVVFLNCTTNKNSHMFTELFQSFYEKKVKKLYNEKIDSILAEVYKIKKSDKERLKKIICPQAKSISFIKYNGPFHPRILIEVYKHYPKMKEDDPIIKDFWFFSLKFLDQKQQMIFNQNTYKKLMIMRSKLPATFCNLYCEYRVPNCIIKIISDYYLMFIDSKNTYVEFLELHFFFPKNINNSYNYLKNTDFFTRESLRKINNVHIDKKNKCKMYERKLGRFFYYGFNKFRKLEINNNPNVIIQRDDTFSNYMTFISQDYNAQEDERLALEYHREDIKYIKKYSTKLTTNHKNIFYNYY